MTAIETFQEITWEQDFEDRINPELMTRLLHQCVPVLKWTQWKINQVGFGFCESMLPLSIETTNQHGTHQAALISLSADYTGGMALTTLLTGTPLAGIHRSQPDKSASLWLVGMDVKYENPSTSHLRATSRVDPKTARRIQQRYFSGRIVLASLEVEFWSEEGQRVAVANMKYFAQSTKRLLEYRDDGEQSSLAKLNMKTSARIIAGLRAMDHQVAAKMISGPDGCLVRVDQSHDWMAAGTQGMLQAKRLQRILPQLGSMVGARTRHADHTVQAFAGLEQLVMLGAGLDMRPIRLAPHLHSVSVFEIDLPVMLAERQRVIERIEQQSRRDLAIPERHQIAADFLKDDVGSLLRDYFAFSDTAATLVIYEGCSMYFDESENLRLLSSIRKRLRHPESRIWFDCVTPAVINDETSDPNIQDFVEQMDSIGEEFVFGPADPSELLKRCGLCCESNLTAGEFLQREDPTLQEYRFVVGKRDVRELGH